MLIADRHRKIAEIVKSEGSIRVAELSKLLDVTEETIRRDLDKLESEGKVVRTHGGAVSTDETSVETSFAEREIFNMHAKKVIATRAIQLIDSGDVISLDASTTAWQVARLIPDIPLTVVTNSVKVVMELTGKQNIEVISVGGTFARHSLSFVGPLAERSLESYHVQKCFLSCRGVHLQYGLTESTDLQAQVKAKMVKNSTRCVLLVDSSKFHFRAFARFAGLEQIDTVITDNEIDPSLLESLKSRVSEVYET